jgi:hypothetical protein
MITQTIITNKFASTAPPHVVWLTSHPIPDTVAAPVAIMQAPQIIIPISLYMAAPYFLDRSRAFLVNPLLSSVASI